jgi:hypothetical protein
VRESRGVVRFGPRPEKGSVTFSWCSLTQKLQRLLDSSCLGRLMTQAAAGHPLECLIKARPPVGSFTARLLACHAATAALPPLKLPPESAKNRPPDSRFAPSIAVSRNSISQGVSQAL